MTHTKEGTQAKTSLTFLALTFALVAAFALAGCGGGGGGGSAGMTPGTGGGGETPMRPPTPMPYVVDGLVANPSTSFIAESAADTLDSVLAAGGMLLAPLTVVIHRDMSAGPDRGVSIPKDGMTYLKSISSDGAGG